MKTVTVLSLLFLLVSPAFSQLTKEDLRTILKEEITASEKRTREYIDLKVDGLEKSLNAKIDGVEASLNAKIDGVEASLNAKIDATNTRIDATNTRIDATNIRIDDIDEKFDRVWVLIIALIGLIAAAIAAPPIIVALKERGQLQKQVEQIHERLNALENTPS